MLILGRYKDQAIFLNNDTMVMVTDVNFDTGQVRLGIDAPPTTPIARAELVARKMEISENLSHIDIFQKMKESHYEWVKDQ